jgi:hypothetical protein
MGRGSNKLFPVVPVCAPTHTRAITSITPNHVAGDRAHIPHGAHAHAHAHAHILQHAHIQLSADMVGKVFGALTNPFSCIYLVVRGSVADLPHTIPCDPTIPHDTMVCGYEYTDDIARSLDTHTNSMVRWITHIDPIYATHTLRELDNYFGRIGREILVDAPDQSCRFVGIAPQLIESVGAQYKIQGTKYGIPRTTYGQATIMSEQTVSSHTEQLIALKDEQIKNIILAKDLEMEKLKHMVTMTVMGRFF